jgi:predicted ATP-binding protein involved in virulence
MPTDTKAPDAMHFRSLSLENVRAFGKPQSLNLFDNDGNISRWNLILGENGVGKTTLMRALAVMRPVPASIQKSGAAGTPTLSTARISEFENEDITPLIRRGGSGTTAMTAVLETAEGASLEVSVEIKGSANDMEDVEFPEAHYALRSDGPLVISYGAGRHVGFGNLERFADRRASDSFSEITELYDAEEIFEKLDHAAKTHDDENDIEVRKFNTLKAVAASILPGFTAGDIEVRGPRIEGRDRDLSGVHVRTPSGVVPLAELSLGYRTMLALIVDLTWRLFNAFLDSPNPINESAIVLIDEIDLHLHPRWQRELARRLMSQFPNTQFIATTHSPVTAQETLSEGGNVAVVRWENGEAQILNRPVPPGNWRFDQVLTDELFPGIASDRPGRVEAKLYERLELIRNSNRSVEQETRLRELDDFVASLPTARTPSDQSFEELMMNIAKDFPSGVAR